MVNYSSAILSACHNNLYQAGPLFHLFIFDHFSVSQKGTNPSKGYEMVSAKCVV
jgi:hypothetical protein